VTTRVVIAFGVVVSLSCEDERLFALLEPQLPAFPCADADGHPDVTYNVKRRASGTFTVVRGRRTVATSSSLPEASERLVADLQTTLARLAAEWTFVHAGVVAIDGGALLFPGRSGAGKTTLVAALLRMGAEYLSDEFAVIGPRGDVHPYSRRLAMRVPGQTFTRVPAEELGAAVRRDTARPDAIVFSEFTRAEQTPLVSLSAGQAVLRLLPHCLGVRSRTRQTLAALHALVRRAPAFANTRADADVMAVELVNRARAGWTPAAVDR
jgi:hypothetical protein